MDDDEPYCTLTGLPVLRVQSRFGNGPCSRLSNVLYWSVVRKSVQQWSFWHDRVAVVTHNRFIITDEDGAVKRFHGIEQISKVTVDKQQAGKMLVLVRFLPEVIPRLGDKDVLLSFNDIDNGKRFISVLETVLNTHATQPWSMSEGDTSNKALSTDHPQHPCPLSDSEVTDIIERDTRQLLDMQNNPVCPTTGLPYATPPEGLTAPNIKMLFCGSVMKHTMKGKSNPRMLFVTLQRLIVADMAGNVKRFHSVQDVGGVRLGGGNILLDMAKVSKDLLLGCGEVERLVEVMEKIRGGSESWTGVVHDDEELTIQKGDGYVPPQVTLFTLRGAQHRRRSTFVLGSFCSQDAALLLDKVARTQRLDVHGIVERAEKVERTRLWQRDLPEEASDMQEDASPANFTNSSLNSVPCVINAFNISIPCDPEKCRTCSALSRQLQEKWKALTPTSTPSLSTCSGRPPVPTLVLNHDSDPLSPVRSVISSARRRIESLGEVRRANQENMARLKEKLMAQGNDRNRS